MLNSQNNKQNFFTFGVSALRKLKVIRFSSEKSTSEIITCVYYQQTTQKELEEQEERLQKLRQLGEDLIEESDHDKETTKDIKAQLQDFDDCWNTVAKRVIDEKEKVLKNHLYLLCGDLGFPTLLENLNRYQICFNRF